MHPKITEQKEMDGFADDVDSETFTDLQRVKLLLSAPIDRVAALQHISGLIAADDGTSLRAKADLFDLHRKLSVTHSQMIKAGK